MFEAGTQTPEWTSCDTHYDTQCWNTTNIQLNVYSTWQKIKRNDERKTMPKCCIKVLLVTCVQ